VLEEYLYHFVLKHLSKGGMTDCVISLCFRLRFLQNVVATMGPSDCAATVKWLSQQPDVGVSDKKELILLSQLLVLASPGLLVKHLVQTALPTQILGRLPETLRDERQHVRLHALYEETFGWQCPADKWWLRPVRASLMPPRGANELSVLTGSPVFATADLPDGRIVTGSGDKMVCIWNAESGDCDKVLEGHTGVSTANLIEGRCLLLPGRY
jgi:hypothetical protein